MNATVVKAHFQRALGLIEDLDKVINEKIESATNNDYYINGLIITLFAHLKGGVDRLDKFYRDKEDEAYKNDLMNHLYGLKTNIKEAMAYIYELVLNRMAMRDLPPDIRMGDKHDRNNDVKNILSVKRTVKYAIEDLDEMLQK